MKKNVSVTYLAFLFVGIAQLASCSKADPTDAIIKHTKSMLKIISDNQTDCEKLVDELTAYNEKNREVFRKLKLQAEELEKDMNDDQKRQYQAETMKKLSGTLQASMSAIMEISKKCPDKAARIGILMNFEGIEPGKDEK